MAELNAKVPSGPLAGKWTQYKDHQNLVNPTNKSETGYHCRGNRPWQELLLLHRWAKWGSM
jgi:hypothetical protein